MKYNKFIFLGSDKSGLFKNLFKNNGFTFCENEVLIQKAIKKKLPPLFYCVNFDIIMGDFLYKYLLDINYKYPFSKYVVEINENYNPKIIKQILLSFSVPKDLVEKFLIRESVQDWGISIDSNLSIKEDLLFFRDEDDPEKILNFIKT
tara:strand:- start:982 stop:1425 length:444 start_codon:yes stop_codon:yes gene_type:complete